jgi:disulfide bond formation protein DsbB
MGLVLALILVALVLGVIGIIARAVRWLLIIAVALFVAGLVRGSMARGKSSA